MSLITGIQDQKDHITQVKKDDKVSPKEKYANRHNKKNPYLLSQANRDKNLTHKSPRLRFFDYAERSILDFKNIYQNLFVYSFLL